MPKRKLTEQPAPPDSSCHWRGLSKFIDGKTQPLGHGELVRIIIGTVAAARENGIRARDVTKKLNSGGIAASNNCATTCLAGLYTKGAFDRLRCGVYAEM